MPALDNLLDRIKGDSDWAKTYTANITQASQIANDLCLIHVTANKNRKLEELLMEPSQEIPTSSEGEPGSNTIKTEDTFGLGRCFYSYAGRACPQFGEVAMAFGPGCEASHTGNVTPFDTGGFYKGLIECNIPHENMVSRETFVQQSMIELHDWRSQFREFLAAYFTPMSNYWSESARPSYCDPDDIYKNSVTIQVLNAG